MTWLALPSPSGNPTTRLVPTSRMISSAIASGSENSFGIKVPSGATRRMRAGSNNRLSHVGLAQQDLRQRAHIGRTGALAPDQNGLRAILLFGQQMNAQPFALRKCRQHALGNQRYSHACDDAAEDGVIGRQLDGALGHFVTAGVKIL